MKTLLTMLLIAVSVFFSSKIQAQQNQNPSFIPSADDTSADKFGNYVRQVFQDKYSQYFTDGCGDNYQRVQFNINKSGKVVNLRLDDSSVITRFIFDILNSTNWKPALKNGRSTQSKTMILPLYFHFTAKCEDSSFPKTKIFYPDYPDEKKAPVYSDNYKKQIENLSQIIFWPITLQGPMDAGRDRSRRRPVSSADLAPAHKE